MSDTIKASNLSIISGSGMDQCHIAVNINSGTYLTRDLIPVVWNSHRPKFKYQKDAIATLSFTRAEADAVIRKFKLSAKAVHIVSTDKKVKFAFKEDIGDLKLFRRMNSKFAGQIIKPVKLTEDILYIIENITSTVRQLDDYGYYKYRDKTFIPYINSILDKPVLPTWLSEFINLYLGKVLVTSFVNLKSKWYDKRYVDFFNDDIVIDMVYARYLADKNGTLPPDVYPTPENKPVHYECDSDFGYIDSFKDTYGKSMFYDAWGYRRFKYTYDNYTYDGETINNRDTRI